MASEIKTYQLKDFIRKNESGDLDYDRCVEIVHEMAAAAHMYSDHNILLDLRETTVSAGSMYEILKLAMEAAQFKEVFRNKMANVIPNNVDRIAIAKNVETALQIKGLQYRCFTNFEAAIEWLSEKKRHQI